MVRLTLEIDEQLATRLQKRADAEGLTPEELAAREVARAVQDPFEFVGVGEADVSAVDADDLLAGGFGHR